MPKRTDIKKIMIIGSGPIVIGQAAEFDYAGTQACLALKEEGYQVILVNSNPATIMTVKVLIRFRLSQLRWSLSAKSCAKKDQMPSCQP